MPEKRQDEQPVAAALAPHAQTLCAVIDQLTRGHEDVQTPIDNLALFRRESVTEPCDCVVEPSVVLVVQGVKQLLIGDQVYQYDPEHFLLNSLDLPAKSGVLKASPEKPALGLVFKLELNIMAELIAQYRLSPPRERTREACAYIGQLTPELLEPFVRLLKLIGKPDDIAVLEPLIKREIHYRLLNSDLAASLWKVAAVGSQSQKIARAIDWIKANYNQPLKVDQLAAHVQMSSSSLHHYFRLLTAKSPLQYQKWLRLSEARRLMLSEGLDAARASFIVGYESPSQFSREYSRYYGTPPKRDIENLRQKTSVIHRASA